MRSRLWVVIGAGSAAALIPLSMLAQSTATAAWPEPVAARPPVAEQDRKPAPRRNIAGTWGFLEGNRQVTNQSFGVHLKPNDGRPEHEPPYTPYGLQLYKAHKALEGVHAVPPSATNDPRVRCEPLGFPRHNHYDLGVQILQDEYKIAVLYQYDNRWRIIWTDGRPLPTLVDGGVETDGKYRESRWMGYSVGRWIDDYTLQVETVGTMPDDRVWLDNTGRPVSDQVRVTETFRRPDHDTLEWSETIDDPKVYTRPWETMKMPLGLLDPRTDVLTRYCSPVDIETYNQLYGSRLSDK